MNLYGFILQTCTFLAQIRKKRYTSHQIRNRERKKRMRSRNRNKKILALLLLSSLCIVLCAGCQKAEDREAVTKKQLTLWYYWDIQENQNHLHDLVEEFNNSQDRTEITLSYIPDEDFKKKLALAMAEGNMPDIALVDSSDFQFLHHMRPFARLDEKIPELKNYMEKALEPCMTDGKIYGQPFGVNCTGMFYNKEILKNAGCTVPENWEEFRTTARKISSEEVSGFAITALQTEESMYEFLPLLWSLNGDIRNISSKASQSAFCFLDDMEREGSLSRQSISLTMGDLTNQFIQGKIAMMFNSSMAVDSIRDAAPDLDFGVAPIPAGDESVTVAGGEIFAVADNENTEAAIEFLKYLADPERMKSYMDEFGFLAPVQSIMDQQFKNEPEKKQFVKMYRNARTREISTSWPRVSLTLADTLKQILMEDEEPNKILKESAEKIRNIEENSR